MEDTDKTLDQIARDHYYCPGPWNEDEFIKDFALFIVVRRQITRYSNNGKINHRLAMNNVVILLNMFGKLTVNQVFYHTSNESNRDLIATILEELDSRMKKYFPKYSKDFQKIIRV